MPIMYTNKYRPYLLKLNDTVVFTYGTRQYSYEVLSHHLRSKDNPGDNAGIFKALGLNKNFIAGVYYTYSPVGGTSDSAWPECKDNDYVALTRLVNHIYCWIDQEGRTKPSPPPEVKKTAAKKLYSIGDYPIKLLEEGNSVIFEVNKAVMAYTVYADCLCEIGTGSNSSIFEFLHLDKKSIASKYYGYPATGCEPPTNWPEYNRGDYAAATRLVNRLFEIIKNRRSYLTDAYINDSIEVPTYEDSGLLNNLKQLTNGNTIETKAITPAIVGGKEISGCRISGKAIRTSTVSRHLSYGKIFG
jgi:hypothetical protein